MSWADYTRETMCAATLALYRELLGLRFRLSRKSLLGSAPIGSGRDDMRLGQWAIIAIICLFASAAAPAMAQHMPPHAAPTTTISVGKLPPAVTKANFERDKATDAYLNEVSGKARARSDAYFEGSYWLILWDTLYTLRGGRASAVV